MVGKVHTVFDRSLTTNIVGTARSERHYDPAHALAKGEELGRFEFGSTLVLVCTRTFGHLDTRVPGTPLQLGTKIGSLRPQAAP